MEFQWINYATAIAVPIISALTLLVAFRQYQIERNELKLALFDKRMAVYKVVMETIACAATKRKLTKEQEINYLKGTGSAKWLFGPEVSTYIEKTLWGKISELAYHNSMLEDPLPDERTKFLRERSETMKWITAQYEAVDRLCSKYLTLGS
jgi:hypothetical protein